MKLHFDGQPDRFSAMRDLFPKVDTTRRHDPSWAQPKASQFRWSRLQAMAQRAIWKIRRVAA